MDRSRLAITILVIAVIFGLLAITLFFPVDGFQIDLIDTMLGAMIGALATAIGFFFREQK